MQSTASSRSYARSLATFLMALGCTAAAFAADTYDPTTRQLTMPSLHVGSALYSNVVVVVGGIVSGPSGTAPASSGDVYTTANNPAADQLSIASVLVGNTPYFNVVVALDGLVSIGGVTGADTLVGNQLSISSVRVDDASAYTNVVVSIGRIVSAVGGMPTVTQDQYNSQNGQLLIPALQEGGTVYTNVTVTVDKVLSVEGSAITMQDVFPYSFRGTSVIYGGGSTDGASPISGGLIQASDGAFYGTTTAGGLYNQGTVFKMTQAGVESVLYSFTGNGGIAGSADGAVPYGGSLIQASDGAFYGTTSLGEATTTRERSSG